MNRFAFSRPLTISPACRKGSVVVPKNTDSVGRVGKCKSTSSAETSRRESSPCGSPPVGFSVPELLLRRQPATGIPGHFGKYRC